MARYQDDMWAVHADASVYEARAEGRVSGLLLDAESDNLSGTAPALTSVHVASLQSIDSHRGSCSHLNLAVQRCRVCRFFLVLCRFSPQASSPNTCTMHSVSADGCLFVSVWPIDKLAACSDRRLKLGEKKGTNGKFEQIQSWFLIL